MSSLAAKGILNHRAKKTGTRNSSGTVQFRKFIKAASG